MILPPLGTSLPVLGIRRYPVVPVAALAADYVITPTFHELHELAHPTFVTVRRHLPDGFHVLATPRDHPPDLVLIIHHTHLQALNP